VKKGFIVGYSSERSTPQMPIVRLAFYTEGVEANPGLFSGEIDVCTTWGMFDHLSVAGQLTETINR
jgi:hypothetical protein